MIKRWRVGGQRVIGDLLSVREAEGTFDGQCTFNLLWELFYTLPSKGMKK